MSATPILKLIDVSKSVPAPAGGADLRILEGIDLELAPGQSLAIVGPSGSGKSTLLHIAGGLDQPSRGRVEIAGRSLEALHESELAAVRNRSVGFVFQAHYLLPQCTVLENVLVPTLAGFPPEGSVPEKPVDRARRLLGRVGLGERLAHRPGQLSGGERQRAAVVRALINRPLLLLADEPTGALDSATASDLGQLLVALSREENLSLVVVTHSRDLAGRMDAQRGLRAGRLDAAQGA